MVSEESSADCRMQSGDAGLLTLMGGTRTSAELLLSELANSKSPILPFTPEVMLTLSTTVSH